MLGFCLLVLLLRVAARRLFVPVQHKLPPQEQLDLFRPKSKNSALENMKKNEDGQISLKLKSKIKVSQDTFIFRFQFPDVNMCLGLPIG